MSAGRSRQSVAPKTGQTFTLGYPLPRRRMEIGATPSGAQVLAPFELQPWEVQPLGDPLVEFAIMAALPQPAGSPPDIMALAARLGWPHGTCLNNPTNIYSLHSICHTPSVPVSITSHYAL
jgi:hypothetical protein